ncbi:MAG: hypothetical protein Q8L81_07280 [Bacteroidota bacterium]|nr:hypothetical protein [Bacteroidota bacterium]
MVNQYKNLFSEAIRRTVQLDIGITVNDLKLGDKKSKEYKNKENKAGVLNHLFRCLRDLNSTYLEEDSIELNVKFKSYLEDYLNCPVALTIGSVYFKEKEVFSLKDGDLNDLRYKTSFQNKNINPHVWFTLPSLEIIDLTFLELFNNKRGLPFRFQKEYEYIFDSIINIYETEKITYLPTLIGVESLIKMDLIKSYKYEKTGS